MEINIEGIGYCQDVEMMTSWQMPYLDKQENLRSVKKEKHCLLFNNS